MISSAVTAVARDSKIARLMVRIFSAHRRCLAFVYGTLSAHLVRELSPEAALASVTSLFLLDAGEVRL